MTRHPKVGSRKMAAGRWPSGGAARALGAGPRYTGPMETPRRLHTPRTLSRGLPALLLCLLALALGLGLGAAPPEPGAEISPIQALTASWKPGQTAAGLAQTLMPMSPVRVELPTWLARKITDDTALFYFSPTCPHCRHIMPEVKSLQGKGGLRWLGVAAAGSSEADLAEFKATFQPGFDILIDSAEREVGTTLAAASTPSLYIARPVSGADLSQARAPIDIIDAWSPMGPGIGSVMLIRRHPNDPFRDFQGYLGNRTCTSCHSQEGLSHALSLHAIAYRTLYMRDRAEDQACVGCHVTGMGQPGGFVIGDHSSMLTGVGCEACHGPSGPHDGSPTVATETCAGCHDAEHSIAFSLEKGVPLIDHFAATGMSEDQLRARLAAMADGSAERPLLAFPKGPTMGAESCKGCHKAVYKSWKKSPHAAAMKSLGEGDGAKPDCARCHATATAMGALREAPLTLPELRTDEGVGCEACHGSGEAHVAAPSKDNIIGLGESCPECVIESICTSCHTPKWDPRWSTAERLKASKH